MDTADVSWSVYGVADRLLGHSLANSQALGYNHSDVHPPRRIAYRRLESKLVLRKRERERACVCVCV